MGKNRRKNKGTAEGAAGGSTDPSSSSSSQRPQQQTQQRQEQEPPREHPQQAWPQRSGTSQGPQRGREQTGEQPQQAWPQRPGTSQGPQRGREQTGEHPQQAWPQRPGTSQGPQSGREQTREHPQQAWPQSPGTSQGPQSGREQTREHPQQEGPQRQQQKGQKQQTSQQRWPEEQPSHGQRQTSQQQRPQKQAQEGQYREREQTRGHPQQEWPQRQQTSQQQGAQRVREQWPRREQTPEYPQQREKAQKEWPQRQQQKGQKQQTSQQRWPEEQPSHEQRPQKQQAQEHRPQQQQTREQQAYPPQQQLPQRQQTPVKQQLPQKKEQQQQQQMPAKTSVSEISKDLGSLSMSMLPQRKGNKSEARGRRVNFETNHLELRIKDPNAVIFHYDVEITPDKPLKIFRSAVESIRQKFFPQNFPAFDGKKNIYSYSRLPIPNDILSESVTIDLDARSRDYDVQIKFANKVDFSTIAQYLRNGSTYNMPREALQALDVVLRNPGSQRFVSVGRSFFSSPSGRIISLGKGMDLWYGFYQSTIIGWKPFLNIDVAHKGFPSPKNCVELFREISNAGDNWGPDFAPRDRETKDFKSFIERLRVSKETPDSKQKRTYRVNDLSECPRNNRFNWENKGMVTVERYYKEHYKYTIKYPLLPCLLVGQSNSIPMELCTVIEGQKVNTKLDDRQTREMVRAAAVGTELRKKKIMDSINKVRFNDDPCIKEFGLTVASQFTRVDGRILDPPTLSYQQGKKVDVNRGEWRSGRFITTNPLNNWFILNADGRTNMNTLHNLVRMLKQCGNDLGMVISDPTMYNTGNIRDFERELVTCGKKVAELVLIILPDWGAVSYVRVKQIAEQKVGVLTQCVKARTVSRLSQSTVVNILLKINAKLNGINHTVTCSIWEKYFSRPIIVFGADVTHPSPGQRGFPSIAAVAASYEPKAFCYNMEWRLQPPKEEIILDLEAIVKKQLLAFHEYNRGMKPERIFFYRDGVSEGFFKKVLDVELQAIRRACSALNTDYKPPITFLVVQKRHHTRFFPGFDIGDRKNCNVPAGTVVDEIITHNREIDFYLVSHASIQGTSRPTKYHVLWDDTGMSEYDIQELTYYLCHLFTRCTRTVSYPAPTYYAHLAAARVRVSYMEGETNLDNLEFEEKNRRAIAQFVKRSPMYFI